jgi:nucleoside phosphorylase
MSAEQGAGGAEANSSGTILVCFAVPEEANPFKKLIRAGQRVKIVLTGMGEANAKTAVEAELRGEKPGLVLSCGFAGGLRPGLETGKVLFSAEGDAALESALTLAGAQSARFYCATSVATTAIQKRGLRESTGADAIEMESQPICAICREQSFRCATVRVILDTAEEDLPLDFNQLMNARQQMDYGKLALVLARSPGKLGALLRLQKQSRAAAEALAAVLARLLSNQATLVPPLRNVQ